MVNDVLKELQANLDKAHRGAQEDLGKVRTGRANVSILDGIRVDYYGTPTPLNQVASLNVPDPRLITIKPWEKSLIPEIEKTIRSSQLGLNPSSDGEIVRAAHAAAHRGAAQGAREDRQEDGRGCQGRPARRPARRQRDAQGLPEGQGNHRGRREAGPQERPRRHRRGGRPRSTRSSPRRRKRSWKCRGRRGRRRAQRRARRSRLHPCPDRRDSVAQPVLLGATPLGAFLSYVTRAMSTWLMAKRSVLPLPCSRPSRWNR